MDAVPSTLTPSPATGRLRRWRMPALALLLWSSLLWLPWPPFWVSQLCYIGLYALVALGLVLLTGVAGLTSFGQAAFVGVGAYASAYLCTALGWSPWATLLAGQALAVGVALVLGALTLRMSGHYLPLATLCWGLALNYAMANMDFLGKYDGLQGVPALSLAGQPLNELALCALIWACTGLAAWGLSNLLDSRPGRALRALKQGAVLPESMGVSTFRAKLLCFVLAAMLAALSGWLFAHFQRSVNPTPFNLARGIEYLFMAVLGGVGQVGGALLGAALVKLLEDQLQVWLPALIGSSGNFETIVFGVVLVAVLRYAPDGLLPVLQRGWRRWVPAAPPAALPAVAQPLPRRAQPAAGTPWLQVQGLSKRFGGLQAVKDIGFSVGAGRILGLIGPNGAGKSTTFNLLSGVLPPSGGEVRLGGQSVTGLGARAMAGRGLSRSFQHVKMVPDMTVLENVALGAYGRTRSGPLAAMLRLDRREEALALAEGAAQLHRIGMGAQMHEQAGNLALGPQRLMEIARALCADPSLLLLDEPAAGLRHQEKQALAAVLRQLRDQGLTLLLVEHDMDFVMGLVDELVVMEFGTLLMAGTPAEVQASPVVRAAYLGEDHAGAEPGGQP